MSQRAIKDFCDEHDLNISSFFKTLMSITKVSLEDSYELGDIYEEEEILEEALKAFNTIPEPFFCDYLTEGQRIRMMLQPQRVWFGTCPNTQEQHWLLTALDIQTDKEITLRLSHINA